MPQKQESSPQDERRPQRSALLLIDVINPFDFPGAKQLYRHALPAARNILKLRNRADQEDVPVIYVNDNFGNWHSDVQALVRSCRDRGLDRGRICKLLAPRRSDYFVLKPRHSGFFLTPLEMLLDYLNVGRVVLTGFSTDICILYTAADAHMRHYSVVVPRDCVAAETVAIHRCALSAMERGCRAAIRSARHLPFEGGEGEVERKGNRRTS